MDESMFRETANWIDYVIRKPDKKYAKEFIHECEQQGGQSVMVHEAIFGSEKVTIYI